MEVVTFTAEGKELPAVQTEENAVIFINSGLIVKVINYNKPTRLIVFVNLLWHLRNLGFRSFWDLLIKSPVKKDQSR